MEKQGHDNRTFRLSNEMLIRLPTASPYALKVPKEQDLLPKIALYLSFNIPVPIAMGRPSTVYPYPFSIYKWLDGASINLLILNDQTQEQLVADLAKFLQELQSIAQAENLNPKEHNYRAIIINYL